MSDIRFYDFNFDLLAIEADFISSNWQVYYNSVGQFEAHFPLTSDLVNLLCEHPYTVAVQGEQAAVVVGWRLADDLTIFGRTCNWLLSKRVVPAFELKKATAEELSRSMVSEAFSDTAELVLDEGIGDRTEVEVSCEEYRLLSDAVCDCLELAGLGHELLFDTKNKKWVFSVYKGTENTLVISEGNRNAAETEFSHDLIDYCSSGWYPKKQETEDGSGYETVWERESSGEKQGIYRWETVLSSNSQAEAKQELSLKKDKNSAAVNAVSVLWHDDYELGDTVRLQLEFGSFCKTATMKIKGVHLWYEEGVRGEQPIMEEVEA